MPAFGIGERRMMAARELPGFGKVASRWPRHAAGFSPARSPSAFAAFKTRSIRPRTREAVSGFVCQIGVRQAKTPAVSTAIDRRRPDRGAIGLQRVAPLLAMFRVGKAFLDPVDKGERIRAEGGNVRRRLFRLPTRFERIIALRHDGARFVAKAPRHGEGDALCGRAQAHLLQLAIAPVEEGPLPRAAGPHDEIQPVAVGIAPRRLRRFDTSRREKVLLALPSARPCPPCPNLPQHLPQLKTRLGANVNGRGWTIWRANRCVH